MSPSGLHFRQLNTDAQEKRNVWRDDYAMSLRKRDTGYTIFRMQIPVRRHCRKCIQRDFQGSGESLLYHYYGVFLIIIGISFVLSDSFPSYHLLWFSSLNTPGIFPTHSLGVNLFYLPDFLNYIVNPAIAPWILILTFIVILMPLLALIYWGVKMIFWFRAKDGIVSIAGLVVWVMCVAALSILLFNEGISFAETAKTVSEQVIEKAPTELYIVSGHKVADLQYDKEISFDEEDYNVFFIDNNKGLYITSSLRIDNSGDNSLRINVRKRSAGRSRIDATNRAEGLLYNYNISGDTLYLDEYFTIPAGSKWSFDNVGINLYIPEGTEVHFDKTTENMFRRQNYNNEDWNWSWDGEDKEYGRFRKRRQSMDND